ncbi:MAG: hypothetical protein ABSH08_10405 [Tepidisphaeraceae bacterium]
MSLDIIMHKGRRCVPVPLEEYERLNDQGPPFPPVDADGISRIESGRQTATVRVIDKLDKAIRLHPRPSQKTQSRLDRLRRTAPQ